MSQDDGSKAYLDFLNQQIDQLEQIKQYHREGVEIARKFLERNPNDARVRASLALHREVLERLWSITLPVGYVGKPS